MKVKIVGSYVDHGWGEWGVECSEIDEVIATFDEKKDALQYIYNSRLKNPQKYSGGRKRAFRSKSLLARFEFATVESLGDPPLHNPQIGKRRK